VSRADESGGYMARSPLGAFPEAALLLDHRGRLDAVNARFTELALRMGRHVPERGDSYGDFLRSTLGVSARQADAIQDKLTYLSIEHAPGLAFVREVECLCDGEHYYHRIQMVQWGDDEPRRILVMHVDVTDARKVERRAELELELCRALSQTPGSIRSHLVAARVFAGHIGAASIAHVPVDERGRMGAARHVRRVPSEPEFDTEVLLGAHSVAARAIQSRAPVIADAGDDELRLARAFGVEGPALRCCAVPSVRLGQLEAVILFMLDRPTPREREVVALFAGLLGVEMDDGPQSSSASVPPPQSGDLDSMASLASDTDAPVLVLGESGVGKTRLAKVIHQRSQRREGPFLDLNCAGLSPQLLESELFGHERGAFTGAHARKMGLLEKAEGGTVLLDEVGELDLTVQAKLLKVIESRAFRRVGGEAEIRVDVRFIAATHRDLWVRVREGAFREDLLYRLNVVQIAVPPLRDSPWRVPALARELLVELGRREGRQLSLTPEAELLLMQQPWRGNIRELANVLARSALGATKSIDERRIRFALGATQDQRKSVPTTGTSLRLDDAERDVVMKALAETGYNIKRAAKRLGIARSTLYDKISRYEIDLDQARRAARSN